MTQRAYGYGGSAEATPFAARHSMDSPEWYTPSPFVESARIVMGSIDLDPASHAEANLIVKAARYYTEADNGLTQPWFGNVLHNPPGGYVNEFWCKAMAEWQAGRFRQMVFIGYSLEQLQTLQQSGAPFNPLHFPTCFTSRRIAFIENQAKKALRVQKILAEGDKPGASDAKRKAAARIRAGKEPDNSPSHSNYISYVGHNVTVFKAEFEQYGHVIISARRHAMGRSMTPDEGCC